MRRLVKISVIVFLGTPASVLALWGLSLVIVVGPRHQYEAPAWIVYGMGATALLVSSVFFALLQLTLRSLSSAAPNGWPPHTQGTGGKA